MYRIIPAFLKSLVALSHPSFSLFYSLLFYHRNRVGILNGTRATSSVNPRVAHRATIADNLGESARDMLMFPIFPATMRVCVRGDDEDDDDDDVNVVDVVVASWQELSNRTTAFHTLCSRFICDHPPDRPRVLPPAELFFCCARFHRFAVSPRAKQRTGIYRVGTELQRNLCVHRTNTRWLLYFDVI